jgi:probable rRNA maturation factor
MLRLHVQIATTLKPPPSRLHFRRWILCVFKNTSIISPVELTIRLVDEVESADLNSTYRHKSGPTNVLSFPFESEPGVKTVYLGDIAVCAPLVGKEANVQNKTEQAHWAHLIIHGVLHLLGYDHIKAEEAEVMESLEIKILQQLGFENPYEI